MKKLTLVKTTIITITINIKNLIKSMIREILSFKFPFFFFFHFLSVHCSQLFTYTLPKNQFKAYLRRLVLFNNRCLLKNHYSFKLFYLHFSWTFKNSTCFVLPQYSSYQTPKTTCCGSIHADKTRLQKKVINEKCVFRKYHPQRCRLAQIMIYPEIVI